MSVSYSARQEAERWTAEHTPPADARDGAQTEPADQSTSPTPSADVTPADTAEFPVRPLLTVAQAAALLKVPEGWLYRKSSRRQIPFTKIGRYLRFSTEDIQAIIRAGARPVRQGARSPQSRPPSRRR